MRLIKTIPRRGYRFEADVSVAVAGDNLLRSLRPLLATRRHLEPIVVAGDTARFALWTTAAPTVAAVLVAAMLWWVLGGDRSARTAAVQPDRPQATSRVADAKPAIAILPFLNQSDDATREHLADGLTQDVINALGRFSELTVMSWNAVFPYKDKPQPRRYRPQWLAVRYQVEGSIRQTGERVRVNAQLVNNDGRVLWPAANWTRHWPTCSPCRTRSPPDCRSVGHSRHRRRAAAGGCQAD